MNNIKNFTEFLDNISEAFNNPCDIIFSEKTNKIWNGDFTVGENEYNLNILLVDYNNIDESEKVYTIKFCLKRENEKIFSLENDESRIYDLKNTIIVLSTIKKYTRQFISEVEPNALFFYCSDNDIKRENIYYNFCEDVIKDYNKYFFFHYGKFEKPLFIIYKAGYNTMNLKNLILDARDFINTHVIN